MYLNKQGHSGLLAIEQRWGQNSARHSIRTPLSNDLGWNIPQISFFIDCMTPHGSQRLQESIPYQQLTFRALSAQVAHPYNWNLLGDRETTMDSHIICVINVI